MLRKQGGVAKIAVAASAHCGAVAAIAWRCGKIFNNALFISVAAGAIAAKRTRQRLFRYDSEPDA